MGVYASPGLEQPGPSTLGFQGGHWEESPKGREKVVAPRVNVGRVFSRLCRSWDALEHANMPPRETSPGRLLSGICLLEARGKDSLTTTLPAYSPETRGSAATPECLRSPPAGRRLARRH